MDQDPSLSTAVIPLFKGVLYRDDDLPLWSELMRLQAQVRDYVAVLGLDLILDESEGYAFLRSCDEGLPRLVVRRQLSYPVSLLLALLRRKLAEFDAQGGETRLILHRDEIVELLSLFFPAGTNEKRLVDQIDVHIGKVVQLGFLCKLRGSEESYEVRRILKAFVDGQWLSELDDRLTAYRAHIGGDDDE